MNYLVVINNIINYLEKNLGSEIDKKYISDTSALPYDIISRLFTILTGFSIHQYFRNRKLSEAAKTLSENSEVKITELAFLYGYDSLEAFNLAFRKYHGKAPSSVLKGASYNYLTPLELQLNVLGGDKLNVKIETISDLEVSALRISEAKKIKKEDIKSIWDDFKLKIDEVIDHKTIDIYEIICDDSNNVPTYYAACSKLDDKLNKKLNLKSLIIPSRQYAIFTIIGSVDDQIEKVIQNILNTFFDLEDNNKYFSPEFAYYKAGNRFDEKYEIKFCIAI
ncbi:AraC family transcriptional regulator [Oceanivirga miroungae]|uniref:HTH araC/xylS-type domain-containing protein n=1 Tax=Oceanivirga miroungae TaxID=1130046 RepID=A0A6I8MC18_9FUSO|nr:helix-turn-helix domain-containing protein [Oceanivirga miroungae]VWL84999.1 hypothetical protein OMES3154_00271 [Oceanivirga miroungae]